MAIRIKVLRTGKRPAGLRLRSSAPMIVTTCSFAVFTDIFLYGVVVPVIPFTLSKRAGVADDQVQLWVSVLLAVFGGALLLASPVWGLMADRIRNRRIPMLVGLIILLGATLFLCFSVNLPMLVIGRALQGAASGLTWTIGLALVVDTVDPGHIGKAMGWIGSATSLGILSSPLLGGVVYGKGGYYSVFAMCFGLIAVDIAMRLAIVEVREAKKWAALNENMEGSQPAKKESSQARDQDSPVEEKTTAPADSSPVAPTEVSAAKPTSSSAFSLKPIFRLLCKPRLLAALWGTTVQALVQTSFDSTLPLLVSSTFGWGSIGAGLIFLPLVLPSFLSPIVGAIGDKYGSKWLTTMGFFFSAPFLVCLRFVKEDSIQHKVMLCGLLTGIGISIAMVFGPLMAEITWSVQGDLDSATATRGLDEEGEREAGAGTEEMAPYALAYALYNVAFSAGTIAGPLMGGLIRDKAGFGTVGWSLAVVSCVTGVTQAMWIGETLDIRSWRRKRGIHA